MSIAEKLTKIAENEQMVYNKGYSDGSGSGYTMGYQDGEHTKELQFWDGVQNFGQRNNYTDAFQCWGMEYIRPRYKVAPTSGWHGRLFINNPNLKIVEKQYFDFSRSPVHTYRTYGNYYTFQFCKSLEKIEDIGLQGKYYSGTFHGCEKLKEIEVLRFEEATEFDANPFHSCNSLTDFKVEGTLASTLSFQWSPLSNATAVGLIGHLKDFSGTDKEYTATLTLKASVADNLEYEGATSPNGNKWIEYIDDLKWNLVTV